MDMVSNKTQFTFVTIFLVLNTLIYGQMHRHMQHMEINDKHLYSINCVQSASYAFVHSGKILISSKQENFLTENILPSPRW